MRIAFVVGGFPEISETFILDQMTGLIDRGHEVTILARPPADPGGRVHAAVMEYRLQERVSYWDRARGSRADVLARTRQLVASHPLRTAAELGRCLAAFRPGQNLVRMWSRASMLRSLPAPDVLYAQFGTNGVLTEQAREICRIRVPLVTNFLGHDLSRLLRQQPRSYYRRLFSRGELLLPLSLHFRDRLVELGCPPEKIRVQHLGVDTRQFAFRERRLEPGALPRFVSVARLVEKKGLEYGLRAFAQLGREVPGATWEIIGDGPLRASLEALSASLGLQECVRFLGALPRESVREVLGRAHILIAPSVTAVDGDKEGTPVAIMEAMASGMPVVSTRHSGIPEVVEDGVSGLLVPERDADALARAIRAVAGAPERWPVMGREGRRIIEREYDQQKLLDRLAEILVAVGSRA